MPPAPHSPPRHANSGPVGQGGRPGITQLSGQASVSGYPTPPPPVNVYSAPDDVMSIVWWAVLLIALVTFGAGMYCGFLLATH